MKNLVNCFIFFPFLLIAQMNESDTLSIKADLSLTGFWQGGNVETIIFRANSNLSFKPWKKAVFKTQNSYVYQEFGKEKADEDILSLNFLNINPHRRFHPLVLAFFSTNFRRNIDYRFIAGAGFSYKILKQKKAELNMSFTSEYENTVFGTTDFNQNQYDGLQEINTWRSTLWISGNYKMFKNKMILTHQMYFQPSLEQRDNFRWRADIGLEFPIWKYLNFKINYLRTYESIVIASQVQEDEFLTFGFKIKSY